VSAIDRLLYVCGDLRWFAVFRQTRVWWPTLIITSLVCLLILVYFLYVTCCFPVFSWRVVTWVNIIIKCMLNHCLEWDKWVLNERTCPTSDSGLTHLFPQSRAVVAYTVVHLVTPDCTRGVIDPLYHSRHNDRDRQYECDRGIRTHCPKVFPKVPKYFWNSRYSAESSLNLFSVKFTYTRSLVPLFSVKGYRSLYRVRVSFR